MRARHLLSIDIGSAAIKTVIAELSSKGILLCKASKYPSAGLRRGVVQDLSDTVPIVSRIFDETRKIAKSAVKNIFVNVGTPQVRIQHSRGIVAVSRGDNEINQEDVDRVVKASQAVSLAQNRMIVHTITREFMVDGIADIENPLGLSGNRLEVSSIVIDAFAPHVKSVMKLIEMAGGEIGAMVFDPLAAVKAALTKRQKELGVVLVDIGAGTTTMAVYEDGKPLGFQVFPVGGGSITNDIAVGLKIPVDLAEQVKLNYGYGIAKEVGTKESIDLGQLSSSAKGSVSRRFVSEIIESRLAEILEFVNNELKLLGKAGELPGGVVFTGGTAKLPGLAELARHELKLSAQIGFADLSGWVKREHHDATEDPEFVNALGLAMWGDEGREQGTSDLLDISLAPRNLKAIFKYFLP